MLDKCFLVSIDGAKLLPLCHSPKGQRQTPRHSASHAMKLTAFTAFT